jgi:hypothetical protein
MICSPRCSRALTRQRNSPATTRRCSPRSELDGESDGAGGQPADYPATASQGARMAFLNRIGLVA